MTDSTDRALDRPKIPELSNRAIEGFFNIQENPNFHLRLSNRHHLIIKGKLRRFAESKRRSRKPPKFHVLINKLARTVVLELKKISLSDVDNTSTTTEMTVRDSVDFPGKYDFFFYIIKDENKKNENGTVRKRLKVFLSIPGRGRYGNKCCSEQHQIYQERLENTIGELGDTGYEIKGVFVPFSKAKGESAIETVNHSFSEVGKFLSGKKDSFINNAFIAKLLRVEVRESRNTINPLTNYDPHLFKWFANLNKARQYAGKIRKRIEEMYGFVDPQEFLESLTLHLLEKIEKEQPINSNSTNEILDRDVILQEYFEKLRKSSDRMHLKAYEERAEDVNDMEDLSHVISSFRTCLKMLWRRSEAIGFSNLLKYQSQCPEDNLIDYLTNNRHILEEDGEHFLFNVGNSIKETPGAEIRIRPSCSYCFTAFPLQFVRLLEDKEYCAEWVIYESLRIIFTPIGDTKENHSKTAKPTIDNADKNKIDSNDWGRGMQALVARRRGRKFRSKYLYNALQKCNRDAADSIFQKMDRKNVEENVKKSIMLRVNNNFPVLHYVSLNNLPERISSFLKWLDYEQRAEAINEVCNSLTPMDIAVISGYQQVVSELLRIADETGQELKQSLVENMLKASLKPHGPSWGPLHLAALLGHEDLLSILLDKGAEKKIENIWETKNDEEWTPLHCAAWENHERALKILLERGAKLEARTKDGFTALHLAAKHGCKEAVEMILEYAEEHLINPDGIEGILNSECGENKLTPLHLAVESNWFDVVQTLSSYSGINLNAKTADGRTPLHIASKEGYRKCIKVLLEEGANIKDLTEDGSNALHLAVTSRCKESIQLILEHAEKSFDLKHMLEFVNSENYEEKLTPPSSGWYKRLDVLNFLSRISRCKG
ncbi:hypothetical protein QAD02_005769 [Eretmocerus hayati]|uniref:Uncharacterized protein n=1 Tax=Eretmocerus hayati TaxID=131215 RepID=A0ACC2NTV9_9HYME|nr:hypothetical protein QAD02_005769 [Eretmocerus hayati]